MAESLTSRDTNIVSHEGFQYIFDKFSADGRTQFYRCRRRDLNCRGRIHINDGNIYIKGNHGGHEESPTLTEVKYSVFKCFIYFFKCMNI